MHGFYRKRTIKSAVCACLVCAASCLSGCTFSLAADNLLTPPKLSVEQTKIYDALTRSAGEVNLKYPRTGEYRSAFVMYDTDGDGAEEAMVFYTASAADTVNSQGGLRVGFLDNADGEWRSVAELAGLGKGVESVEFLDAGNAAPKILISYSAYNSQEKMLSVASFSNGAASEIAQLSYSHMTTAVLTDSGREDVLVFSAEKETGGTIFSAYGTDGTGRFAQLSNSVRLLHSITSYSAVTTGRCLAADGEEIPCVAIDYMRTENQYGTDLIYYKNGSFAGSVEFTAQMQDKPKQVYSRRTNVYTPAVNSHDVNGDGYIDIPTTTVLPCYESAKESEQLNAVLWYADAVTDSSLTAYTFMDPCGDYMLIFPGRWIGMVTAVYDAEESTVTFWKMENGERSQYALLNIKTVSADNEEYDEDTALREGYKYFGKNKDTQIYCRSIMYEGLSLTNDELSASLKILTE